MVLVDAASPTSAVALPWYRGLSRYQWFVLLVCFMGWFFDTFDMQLFIIARAPAMAALVHQDVKSPAVSQLSGIATAVFMLGAATGGILFGILGDRWGRAKTLFTTVLVYSCFTGLSACSASWIDFSFYRFLTGMGVGGTFAAAVALISEIMPARSRPQALAMLQALAAIGNMAAALVTMLIKPSAPFLRRNRRLAPDFRRRHHPHTSGPPCRTRLSKNPKPGSRPKPPELNPPPSSAACANSSPTPAGVATYWWEWPSAWPESWASGASPSGSPNSSAPPSPPPSPKKKLDMYVSLAQLLFNFAAAVGTYLFGTLMTRIGRKPTFAIGFIAAIASIICVFGFMTTPAQVWWMAPLLGFCTLSLLGGYSVYFPELFPLRLRATGVGICYNTARYLSAFAPFTLGLLTSLLAAPASTERAAQKLSTLTFLSSLGGSDSPLRYAAIIVASVYLIGLIALPFAVETRGKPLPE